MPTSERSAPETKTEDQKRVEAARRGQENYIKKLKEKLLKNNVEAQTTLKEFIEYFQQNLNDPASTLMAIEETTSIIKEEHKTDHSVVPWVTFCLPKNSRRNSFCIYRHVCFDFHTKFLTTTNSSSVSTSFSLYIILRSPLSLGYHTNMAFACLLIFFGMAVYDCVSNHK